MKKFFVLLLVVAAIVFTMSGCSAVVDSLKTGVSRIINGGIGEYAEEFKNIVTLPGDVIEENIVPEEILKLTKSDKKMQNGRIKFILLKKIGKAVIDTTVTDEEMLDAIEFLNADNLEKEQLP